MSRVHNRLTQAGVTNAKPGMHADGGGLYLQVTTGAAGQRNRSWIFRYAVGHRERQMGLGSLIDVKLAEARDKAAECRRQRRQGIDPLTARDEARRTAQANGVTFRKSFDTFFVAKRQTLSNGKHADQWKTTMDAYVFPVLGDRPVAEVETAEILELITPIWFDKAETARRVLQRIEAVFKSAILRGHRQRASPCIGVKEELGTRHRKTTNHRAMPYSEIPAFLAKMRASNSQPVTKLAFEWLVLTATRSGEARLTHLHEIDEQTQLWTIPAERMKNKKPHVIPLASRCLEILRKARALNPSFDFLFPSFSTGAPLSDMTFTKVLRDLGYGERATPHGMRSAFKDWCAEVAKVRDEVSEAALAHTIPDKVRAAYLRTNFLEERKRLMRDWAEYCSGPG